MSQFPQILIFLSDETHLGSEVDKTTDSSGSEVDKAIESCRRDFQEIGPPFIVST